MAMGGSNQTNYLFIIHKGKLKKNIPYSIARYIYHWSGLKSKLSLLNPLLSEKNKRAPLNKSHVRFGILRYFYVAQVMIVDNNAVLSHLYFYH